MPSALVIMNVSWTARRSSSAILAGLRSGGSGSESRVRGLRLAVNSSTGTSPTPAKGRPKSARRVVEEDEPPRLVHDHRGRKVGRELARQDENQVLGSPLARLKRTPHRRKVESPTEGGTMFARVATFESTDPAADEQLMGQAMETVEPMIRGLNGIQGFIGSPTAAPASRSRSASSTRRRTRSRRAGLRRGDAACWAT